MNWKAFTINAWRANYRWVAFNVMHVCNREAKCFKSAIDANQYCNSKNNRTSNWQFDHLGNIKVYFHPEQKNQIDWNDLCGKLNQFHIKAITKEQPLLSQLADGLYCMGIIRKPCLPLSSFKKYKIVKVQQNSSNERWYDDYLEALKDLYHQLIDSTSGVVECYGVRENACKEFAELLFTVRSNQDPGHCTSAFESFCDPTLVTLSESVAFIRYKKDQKQLLFYDECSKSCSWHQLPLHFDFKNFYSLKTNISKFKFYE